MHAFSYTSPLESIDIPPGLSLESCYLYLYLLVTGVNSMAIYLL
jgi:hypothetical protein